MFFLHFAQLDHSTNKHPQHLLAKVMYRQTSESQIQDRR